MEIRQADGSSEYYGYDHAGNMTSATDGEGNTTTYEYSGINQLSVMTDPTGEQEVYYYDAQERLCRKTDRNGTETTYVYNIYDNLTERRAVKSDGTGLTDRYEYTPEGLLKSAISQGMRYNYAYDALGRLTEKKASGRTLLSFQYDLNGNLTRQTDVTGKVTEYHYDLADNIREVRDNGKKIAEYEYNADNTIKRLKNGSLYTEYAYDADRNLTGLKTLLGAETIVENRYTYDGNGDRLEKYQKYGTTRYGYDSMRRLAKVEYPNATEELFYDKAGNRTRRLYNGAEELYQYDKRNRLTAHMKGGVTSQYEYDNAGNLLKDDRARYEYDAFNRNTKVETFNGNIQINRYDAEGLCHEMEENGKMVSFIFRGDEVVAEESQEDRIRYIRTSVLLSSDAESARTYYHYASDEMSSVTHAVDCENEEILNRYEYDAWGNLTTCEEKVQNRFKFIGQQYDPISQQYYLRARYYNPVIGRFTQEDSYNVDGLNLYAYCRNNPVYYVDPSGNICETAADRIRKKVENNTATFWERKKLEAYDRNKERIERAEANYKLARDVYDQYKTAYGKKTVASDGEHFTISGWSKELSDEAMIQFDRDRNLTGEVVDVMRDMEKRTGGDYEPKPSWKDNGVENKYYFYASHAEKQVSIYGGSEIGVTRNMCSDCVKYFTTKAKGAEQDIIIADRMYIHIFTTTGDHIQFCKSRKDII